VTLSLYQFHPIKSLATFFPQGGNMCPVSITSAEVRLRTELQLTASAGVGPERSKVIRLTRMGGPISLEKLHYVLYGLYTEAQAASLWAE